MANPTANLNELSAKPPLERIAGLIQLAQTNQANTISTAFGITEDYKVDLWKRLKLPQVKTWSLENILTETKYLFYKIFENQDKTAVFKSAAKLATQIRLPEDPTKLGLRYDLAYSTCSKLMAGENHVDAEGVSTLPADWATTPALLVEPVKSFMDSLNAANQASVSIWAPWFAIIVMRLEKRQPDATANKLKGLVPLLRNVYKNTINLPDLTNTEFWIPKFANYLSINIPELSKNVLYIAMIRTYHEDAQMTEFKGLMDFAFLQSLRYTGMMVTTLVDQTALLHGITPAELMKEFHFNKALEGWTNYLSIKMTYMNKLTAEGKDPMWSYSREFFSGVFSELSYPKNEWFCLMFAVLIDLRKNERDYAHPNTPGPTYNGLVQLRKSSALTGDEYATAVEIHKELIRKHVFATDSDSMKALLQRALERSRRWNVNPQNEDPLAILEA